MFVTFPRGQSKQPLFGTFTNAGPVGPELTVFSTLSCGRSGEPELGTSSWEQSEQSLIRLFSCGGRLGQVLFGVFCGVQTRRPLLRSLYSRGLPIQLMSGMFDRTWPGQVSAFGTFSKERLGISVFGAFSRKPLRQLLFGTLFSRGRLRLGQLMFSEETRKRLESWSSENNFRIRSSNATTYLLISDFY